MPKRPERGDLVTFLRSLDGRVRQVERHKHPVGTDEETTHQHELPRAGNILADRNIDKGNATQSLPASTETTCTFVQASRVTDSWTWSSVLPSRVISNSNSRVLVQAAIFLAIRPVGGAGGTGLVNVRLHSSAFSPPLLNFFQPVPAGPSAWELTTYFFEQPPLGTYLFLVARQEHAAAYEISYSRITIDTTIWRLSDAPMEILS